MSTLRLLKAETPNSEPSTDLYARWACLDDGVELDRGAQTSASSSTDGIASSPFERGSCCRSAMCVSWAGLIRVSECSKSLSHTWTDTDIFCTHRYGRKIRAGLNHWYAASSRWYIQQGDRQNEDHCPSCRPACPPTRRKSYLRLLLEACSSHTIYTDNRFRKISRTGNGSDGCELVQMIYSVPLE